MIAFLGSVFSPWYAWAGRGGRIADPLDHCCFHAALYPAGPERAPRRWAMTERGRTAVHRDAECLRIGRSAMRWDGTALTVALDEVTAPPVPRRVRGRLRVEPRAWCGFEAELSAEGRHRWTPLAPSVRVEVVLDAPALRWSGEGYLDGNHGAGPIGRAFRSWHWCRLPLGNGRTAIDYEAERRDGTAARLSLLVGADGTVSPRAPAAARSLARTRWGIHRPLNSDAGPALLRTLVDAPFYARSAVRAGVDGLEARGVHESLDCDRFERPWVQAMLPFRVPRVPAPLDRIRRGRGACPAIPDRRTDGTGPCDGDPPRVPGSAGPNATRS